MSKASTPLTFGQLLFGVLELHRMELERLRCLVELALCQRIRSGKAFLAAFALIAAQPQNRKFATKHVAPQVLVPSLRCFSGLPPASRKSSTAVIKRAHSTILPGFIRSCWDNGARAHRAGMSAHRLSTGIHPSVDDCRRVWGQSR